MNVLEGTPEDGASSAQIGFRPKDGETVQFDRARVEGAPGLDAKQRIHPTHLRLADGEGGRPFCVRAVEQLGGETYAYGTMPGSEHATLHLTGQVHIKGAIR